MELSIIDDNLDTGMDLFYNESENKIDVYTNVDWRADTKEEYDKKEKVINDYVIKNDLFELCAWCDGSGFEYWGKQEDSNYVSLNVILKKDAEQYTQDEMVKIKEAIIEADQYLDKKLA
jgi:hypothetical protein